MYKTIKLLLLLSCVLLFTGCSYSEEELQQMEQYMSQAKENAIKYIQNKYGFQANIIDTKTEKYNSGPVPDFTPPPTGNVFVEMEYKNIDFCVYITGKKESTEGLDNYQLKDISQDILLRIQNQIPSLPYRYSIYYGNHNRLNNLKYNGLIDDYYDGNNLNNIQEKNDMKVVCEYIQDVDFHTINNNELLFNKAIFIQYYSLEAFHNVSAHHYNILGSPIGKDIYKNAPYINQAYIIDHSQEQHIKPSLHEYNGIYFSSFEDNETTTIEETFVDDASLRDGHGAKDATQLSKGYSIQTNANLVYLYIPTHKIKNFNNYERVIVAIQYIYNGNQSYKTNISYIIGDYLVTKVYIRDYQDIRFTLLGEK